MGPPRLHLAFRYCPGGLVPIDLVPLAMAKLTWPHKNMWCNLEGEFGRGIAFEIIDSTEQPAQLLWFEDRRVVPCFGRDQCTLQDRCWIGLALGASLSCDLGAFELEPPAEAPTDVGTKRNKTRPRFLR